MPTNSLHIALLTVGIIKCRLMGVSRIEVEQILWHVHGFHGNVHWPN
jgi:hypothetical protein